MVLQNADTSQHVSRLAEVPPPWFIFQEKTVKGILIGLRRAMGRWQAEKSEQMEVERGSAGDVPKQEAQRLDKWM